MSSPDVKELSLRNRAQHARRLRELKRSVEHHRYRVNASLVAGDMIREAYMSEAAKRLSD